jgi:myo-inositol-1(or 4)-monophosphatase
MHACERADLVGARLVGQRNRFADRRWKSPWPAMDIIERQSIAYRLALVASGQADATVLFGFKNEWDIAAGVALVEAAGGRASDLWGEALKLNQPVPRAPGVAAAGANLHPLLIERTRAFPDPRQSKPS